MVIFVEFNNFFDFEMCFELGLLKKEVRIIFESIFSYFNDV